MLIENITEIIGNTPILKLDNIKQKLNLKSDIYAKLEYLNPAGSVKDRAALYMIQDAETKGLLCKGGTVIEPTSGNTGIGLAMVCKSKGYNLILTMPETMSIERQKIVKAYGANVVLTDATKGMQGAIDKAKELNKELPNSFIAGQFENNANAEAHRQTTGPEIYNDLNGEVDYFVSAFGSGGTITGTGEFLKSKNKNVKIIAVEPKKSPLLSKGFFGQHKIQGIGANFIPKLLNKEIIDYIITVSDSDAFKYSKILAKTEGVLCGISSGAALKASIDIAKKEENKKVVVILPDSADRYYSTELF